MSRTRVLVLLLTVLVSSLALVAAEPARHVVLISIDGMRPASYTSAGPAKIPTLRALAARGAYASGVVGVLPTVTYPSHTTMITGVPPAIHGIVNNTWLDPEARAAGAWYWYARDIKVPTLPGLIRASGMTAAAVSWPVTVGMDLDYNVPEHFRSRHPEALSLLRALSTPRHLIDGYESSLAAPMPWPPTDDAAHGSGRVDHPHVQAQLPRCSTSSTTTRRLTSTGPIRRRRLRRSNATTRRWRRCSTPCRPRASPSAPTSWWSPTTASCRCKRSCSRTSRSSRTG